MINQLLRRFIAQVASPRSIIPLFVGLTVIYCVVYLMWANPASREPIHRKLKAGNYVNFINTGQNSLQPRRGIPDDSKGIHTVRDGRGVWVTDRHIQIMSAIHDMHHPQSSGIRIVLPTLSRHSSKRDFVCCFSSSSDSENYVQVPASLDYIDLRFVVDLQNAVFECVHKGNTAEEEQPFTHVSFAPESCSSSGNMSAALKIFYPVRRSWEFAVCTKVAYARLDPIRLVEWFEYMQAAGVSKVLTFYNNLHPDSRRVFDYYVKSGLLELIEYMPRSVEGGATPRYTERNAQTRQARHEKTLVVRDCQYRLGGYDLIMTIDFDELPVPLRPFGSLNWIFQDLMRNHTDGSAFRMDPILLPPEWKDGVQDLYHWQFSKGTYITPYCVKWVYIPGRTWLASTHENIPKTGYQTYVISQDVLHFLHFRTCKTDWQSVNCNNITQTVKGESSLKRFAGHVLQNMSKLPLESLIQDQSYVSFVRGDRRNRDSDRRVAGRETKPMV